MIYNGVSGVADQTWGIESPSHQCLQELGGSTQREEEDISPPPPRGMAKGAEKGVGEREKEDLSKLGN